MASGVSSTSVVGWSKDQVSCHLSGEVAILQLQAGIYYGLDPVGARVWSLLKIPHSVNQISQVLLKEYDVEASLLEKDILALIKRLETAGLVEIQVAAAR